MAGVPTPRTTLSEKDARENAAANVVARHLTSNLGAELKPRRWDDGSAAGMHDFYVEGDVHKIALEVTTIADGSRVGRDVRWERVAPGGWLELDGLQGVWNAYAEAERESADVVAALSTHLPALEGLGLTDVDTRSWQSHMFTPPAQCPLGHVQRRSLHAVGVSQLSKVPASQALLNEHSGKVQVLRGFGGTRPSDRNFPAAFIEEQLSDPDLHASDVAKLAAVTDASERHVWMWVELQEGFPMIRSLQAEGLPDIDVEVSGIDGVWIGRGPAPGVVAGVVWRRGLGWSEFSAPRVEVLAR